MNICSNFEFLSGTSHNIRETAQKSEASNAAFN